MFWRRLGVRTVSAVLSPESLPEGKSNLPVICVGQLLIRQRISGNAIRIGLAAGAVGITELVKRLDLGGESSL